MKLPLVDWTGWSPQAIDAFGPRWHALTQRDFVLRGTASAMTAPPRRSALTAKFALGGVEHYRAGDAQLAADDDTWVVLAPGELYSSRIAAGVTVTTVAGFYAPGTIGAARSARPNPAALGTATGGRFVPSSILGRVARELRLVASAFLPATSSATPSAAGAQ